MRHVNRDADHLNSLRQYFAQNRRIPSYQRIADLLGFASRAAGAAFASGFLSGCLSGFFSGFLATFFAGALAAALATMVSPVRGTRGVTVRVAAAVGRALLTVTGLLCTQSL